MELIAALVAASVIAGGVALVVTGLRPQLAGDAGDYLRSLDGTAEEADEYERLLAEPFLRRVMRPLGTRTLDRIAGLTPRNYIDGIHRQLTHAGISASVRAEELVTAQVLGGGLGLVLAVAYAALGDPSPRIGALCLVVFPVVGILAPQTWLKRKVEERRNAIRKDLPDTIDLMAISVEAGLGLEGAMDIVCRNFDSPLAIEFNRTLKEMELGLPRRDALQNLKRRTGVPELSNFVLVLTQADALGMPIGRILKTQAGEMRSKRRQWAREKAGKLPVKILFPLVLFIFPAILVVILGPAFSTISGAF
ncbi:MAG: type II secretion system F family protein [Acidimicrobiales bacterium]